MRWADGWGEPFEPADVILWATGFRPAIDHLAPLHLRSPHGGIQLDGTTAVIDPRVQLVGYGPSASTIGANRAGRAAARGVANWLASSECSAELRLSPGYPLTHRDVGNQSVEHERVCRGELSRRAGCQPTLAGSKTSSAAGASTSSSSS